MNAKASSTLRSAMLLPLVLIAYFYVSVSPLFLYHHDLGWHLAAGDFIRATGTVPEHAIYTFTAETQRWYNLSWLWDVAASFLYQHGGFDALVLFTILIGVALSALIICICMTLGSSPLPAGIAAVVASCLYPFYTSPPDVFLCAAPQVATLLFLSAFCLLCIKNRLLWLLPLCMLLWANIHGGFPAGLVTIGAFTIQFLLDRHRSHGIRLLGIGIICALVTFVTPLGIHIYDGVLQTLHNPSNDFISEWQPFLSRLSWPMSYLTIIYIAAFVALDLRRPDDNQLAVRLLSWLWLLMGLWKLRYLSVFFVFSAPNLAVNLTRVQWPITFLDQQARKLCGIVIAVIVLVAIVPNYYLHFSHRYGLPKGYYPDKEIAYLKEHLPHCILLNNWNYGGFIIFAARGNPAVFIDGRAGTAYPDEVMTDYDILLRRRSAAEWKEILGKYKIDTVLWPRTDDRTIEFFDRQPEWTVAYRGDVANIYTKQ